MIIRINDRAIDIDDKTAIGIIVATYDVANPARPLVSVSNNFSIPKTANNLAAIGFAGSAYYFSSLPYEPMLVTIYDKHEIIVRNAKARVEAINDRIELLIYQKDSFWDEIKTLKLKDIAAELLDWLKTKRGVNTASNKFTGSLTSFLSKYADATSGIILPYTMSTLYPDVESVATQVYKKQGEEVYSAHAFIWLTDIFAFIADKYGVSFSMSDDFGGNIFSDEYFLSAVVMLPNIIIRNDGGYYFDAADEAHTINNIKEAGKDITLYSIIDAAIKLFNIVIDYGFFDGAYKYRLYRFDKIIDEAPIIDWSGKIAKITEFRPIIENVKQLSDIAYKAVPDGFPATYAGKQIVCKNKNIDAAGKLIEIPAFAFGFVLDGSAYVPNLSSDAAYSNVVIAVMTNAKLSVLCKHDADQANVTLSIPALYDLSNEYNLLAAVYEYPQVWTIEKWLTLSDVANFRNFAQYYIDILGASFIVSRIDGFSLTAKAPTKVTLVKISDATIKTPTQSNYWIDGVGNIFTDGNGNYFEYSIN